MHLSQSELPSVERVVIVPAVAQYDGADEVPVGAMSLWLRPHDDVGLHGTETFSQQRGVEC